MLRTYTDYNSPRFKTLSTGTVLVYRKWIVTVWSFKNPCQEHQRYN